MGVWIKVYGGRVVKRAVERYWPNAKEAREYLDQFGLPKTVRGTHFEHEDYKFSLSHPIEDIRTNDDLPDNSMSTAMRPRETKKAYVTPSATFKQDEERLLSGSVTDSDAKPKPSGIKRPSINGKVICLKEICRELKMEPRAARVILRKKIKDRDPNARWEWPAAEADKIKEILRSEA